MKKITLMIVCACRLSFGSQNGYQLVVLDESPNESASYGINSYGFSVGYKTINGVQKPYVWAPDRSYYELPTPSSVSTATGIAYSINDYLDVVGTYGNFGSMPYPVSSGTAAAWVLDFDAIVYSAYNIATSPARARDVNNSGEVAGTENPDQDAYLRNMFTGEGYASTPDTHCFGVNAQGNGTGMQIDGNTYYPTYVRKGTNGTYSVVSGFFAFQPFGSSVGLKINANNQVVGTTSQAGFYWEPETSALTVLAPGNQCYSINNLGVIVGTSSGIACLWNKGPFGTLLKTDLNSFTGTTNIVLERAFGINDQGQIVGQCLNLSTRVRSAFMLTPANNLKPEISNEGAYLSLTWNSVSGHYYSVRVSHDLQKWSDSSEIYFADGPKTSARIFPDSDRAFFTVFDLNP